MSSSGSEVAFCDVKAARYAVERWHYSSRYPAGKAVTIGVWEEGQFTGAVVFGWGANHNLSKQFGLAMTECCELTRIAMKPHQMPVSEVISRSLRLLAETSPAVRAVVSFADPVQGHVGTVYQAANWIYLGRTHPKKDLRLNGRPLNRRAYTGRGFRGEARKPLPPGARWISVPGKHRYAFPMDRRMRRQLSAIAQPYPQQELA